MRESGTRCQRNRRKGVYGRAGAVMALAGSGMRSLTVRRGLLVMASTIRNSTAVIALKVCVAREIRWPEGVALIPGDAGVGVDGWRDGLDGASRGGRSAVSRRAATEVAQEGRSARHQEIDDGWIRG